MRSPVQLYMIDIDRNEVAIFGLNYSSLHHTDSRKQYIYIYIYIYILARVEKVEYIVNAPLINL
jgi:hypothetical protein